MKRLTIDITDTLRDETSWFARYYKEGIDRTFDVDNLVYDEDDFYSPFKFQTIDEKQQFINEDFPYELKGCAPPTNGDLPSLFNIWLNNLLEFEGDVPQVTFTCPNEYHLSIQSTLYFLSKVGCKVRNITFPTSSKEVWEYSNIVISANPIILRNKPEGKISIKINTKYNQSIDADYTYDSLVDFIRDKKTWMELFEITDE